MDGHCGLLRTWSWKGQHSCSCYHQRVCRSQAARSSSLKKKRQDINVNSPNLQMLTTLFFFFLIKHSGKLFLDRRPPHFSWEHFCQGNKIYVHEIASASPLFKKEFEATRGGGIWSSELCPQGHRYQRSSEKGLGERLQSAGQCGADCVLSLRTMGLALRLESFVVSIPLTLNSCAGLYF